MCPLSIYCVLSTPLAGGARVTLQTAHMSSPLSKQCARVARCTMLIIPYTRSFLCASRIRRSRMSGYKKIALAANIRSSKYYSSDVPGPTCRGPALLYMPPLAIKGEACNVTKQAQSLGLDPGHPRQLKLSSNTTHSGVGYYAPAARTTLNSCVFLCSFLHPATGKTLRPLLILGFRAMHSATRPEISSPTMLN
jgi:hypothetical protein